MVLNSPSWQSHYAVAATFTFANVAVFDADFEDNAIACAATLSTHKALCSSLIEVLKNPRLTDVWKYPDRGES